MIASAPSLTTDSHKHEKPPSLLWAVTLAAMAGGMGWGIRGQYGHESGAMIAGLLVGFTLVLLFLPRVTSLQAARSVALIAVGISFGGSMTYGQTVGLTHDAPLVGHWDALRWGLLGLFMKGGIWIAFAGLFFGMGLSGKQYRPLEMTGLLLAMVVLLLLGMWTVNGPFDPQNHRLPRIYFSDHWHWEPGSDLKPRPECWGGLLFALASLTAYVHWIRRDRLARNMAITGFLAGGLGFSLGQCVQAFHAWNPHLFQSGLLGKLEPHMNWWNMMEISFGMIFGGGLALGLWLNRHAIAHQKTPDRIVFSPPWEFVLFAVHLCVVLGAEFLDLLVLEVFLEIGFLMALLPLIGILGGRYWPYLFTLPIVAAPIAGKTLRELAYKNQETSQPLGWLLFVAVPFAVTITAAIWLAHRGKKGQTSRWFARAGLLLTTCLYFGLNFAFFRLPWPWKEWTGRTPSAIIFTVCALALTAAALFVKAPSDPEAVSQLPTDPRKDQ